MTTLALFLADGTNPNDGYLWVNHEYVSYPISRSVPEVSEDLTAEFRIIPLSGWVLPLQRIARSWVSSCTTWVDRFSGSPTRS